MADDGKPEINKALDRVEDEAPDRVVRVLRWLREPKMKWVRVSVGLLFVAASFLWFLPVLGLELLPVGLLLLAQDVPFLRKPVGRAMLWLEDQWCALKRRLRERRRRRAVKAADGA